MKRLIGMVTFVVLASTGPMVRAAAAKDFCISLNSGGGIVVGQRFKVPRPGKCKLFNGFSQNDPTTLVSGNACGTSDGLHVRFNLTTSNTIENLNITLDLPALTGTVQDCVVAGCQESPATAIPCSPDPVPVP